MSTTDNLSEMFRAYLAAEKLPEAAADELLFSDIPTAPQREWLDAFVTIWNDALDREDNA